MNTQIKENLESQIKEVERKLKEVEEMKADPELREVAEEEVKKLAEEKRGLETALAQAEGKFEKSHEEGQPEGETDLRAAIVEIRPAAGGEEAAIWAHDLLRMYLRFANSLGWKVAEIDDLVIKVSGTPLLFPDSKLGSDLEHVQGLTTRKLGPYGVLKYEAGVHRVQRVPVTESQGRIHTSTATVAVLPEIGEAELKIEPGDIVFEPFRGAQGHGGQNVNKVATAVRLTHKPTGLVVESRRERYQEQNRRIAMQILMAKLWEWEEEKREKETQGLRQAAVGRGMRAEKIRTYNFPQNRVTDHRVKKSWHNLEAILNGELGKVVGALVGADAAD
jgi:peptide chain release factor 1